ncbi:MAG: alpha/beta hydrolase [Desulfobacterales bacterium]|jgi:lysophospholipase
MFDFFDTFVTSDGCLIRWAFKAPRLPEVGSVVLLGGRSEFAEKYGEVASELSGRGFSVWTMDWRGQGGSCRLLSDPMKGHVGSFEDYLDDLDQFMGDIVRPSAPAPLVLLAHSMGGHLGLRFLGRRPEIFHRAVLTAPMVDIHLSRPMKPSIRLLSRFMTRLGFAHVGVPGTGDDGGGLWRFEGNPLTSDRDRFERNSQFVRKEPRLAIGGVTFGWAKAAFDSIEKLGAPGEAESLPVPVLMVSPQLDTVVSLEAQRRFCRRCNRCRQALVDGALHEILMESDSHRRIFWRAFDEDTATRP